MCLKGMPPVGWMRRKTVIDVPGEFRVVIWQSRDRLAHPFSGDCPSGRATIATAGLRSGRVDVIGEAAALKGRVPSPSLPNRHHRRSGDRVLCHKLHSQPLHGYPIFRSRVLIYRRPPIPSNLKHVPHFQPAPTALIFRLSI